MNKANLFLVYGLCLAGLVCSSSCSKSYDDTELRNSIGKMEQRAGTFDSLIEGINTNIQALQAMAQALSGEDYLESVSQDNATGAVTLKFAKSGTFTLTQGSKGADGVAPQITIARAEDNNIYWKIGESWLLDSKGQRVSALAANGKTPRLKVEGGMWYISYDEGKTWETRPLGKAVGESGVSGSSLASNASLVAEIDQDSSDKYIRLKLHSGEYLDIPREGEVQVILPDGPPELIETEGIGMDITPIKVQVSHPNIKDISVGIQLKGALDLLGQVRSREDNINENTIEYTVSYPVSKGYYASTIDPEGQVASVLVHVFRRNSKIAGQNNLIKTFVFPVKYRKVKVFNKNRSYLIAEEGETLRIPTMLDPSFERSIIFPSDLPYTFRQEGEVIVVEAPANNGRETLSGTIVIGVKGAYPVIQRIELKQNSLMGNMYTPQTIVVDLNLSKSVEEQLREQGFPDTSSSFGMVKVKGSLNTQTLSNWKNFSLSGVLFTHTLDIRELPTPEIPMGLANHLVFNQVLLPNTLKTIGQSALSGLLLTSLRLPDGLQDIKWGALEGTEIESGDLLIPHSVTRIRNAALRSLRTNNLALPNGITELSKELCSGSTIKRVILPSNPNFTKIGEKAFFNCTKLQRIHCHLQTPPSLDKNAFANLYTGRVIVYIPTGTKAKYLASDWAKYFDPRAFVEVANAPIAEELFKLTSDELRY